MRQAYTPTGDLLPLPLVPYLWENIVGGLPFRIAFGPLALAYIPSAVCLASPSKREKAGAGECSEERTKAASQPTKARRIRGKESTKSATVDSSASRAGASGAKSSLSPTTFTTKTAHGRFETPHRKSNAVKLPVGKRIRAGLCEKNRTRYICPSAGCGKHFSTSGHARRHSHIHNKLRQYTCPHAGCCATFTRRDNCTHHQRVQHH